MWTPEPPPGLWPRPVRIFTRRPRLPAVVHFLTRYGCPPRMTFDRDTRLRSAVTACAISPQHSVAFGSAWAFSPTSAQSYDPTKIPMWSGCTARSTRNGGLVRLPTTLGEVREATKGFLWHYNQERPQEANSLWQSAATGRLSEPASPATAARTSRPGSLAGCHPWAGVFPQNWHRWCRGRG